MIQFFIPGKVSSIANLRLHWSVKASLVKHQRHTSKIVARSFSVHHLKGCKLQITMVRHGVRQLDSDNLASACKAYRDGIADALEMDDGSKLLSWVYCQKNVKKFDQGLTVRVETQKEVENALLGQV